MASLGCLITILVMANSNFAQQLIGIIPLPKLDTERPIGDIARSEVLNTSGLAIDSIFDEIPSNGIITAMLSGAFFKKSQPPLVNCPTGNCAWPPVPSLAICGACEESSLVLNVCFDKTYNYTLPSGQWRPLLRLQHIRPHAEELTKCGICSQSHNTRDRTNRTTPNAQRVPELILSSTKLNAHVIHDIVQNRQRTTLL
ncbi:hypothetical protein K461DRAFT_74642 [Myriangium duriaei CBS 260.36]|uniref:Uncharacterized protein n=1 Tax=Myriangium duriaei CBS 260.36 TaxID=1168546 RepID=A0A9P4MI23_9PEZI|nr:hypothetical protein K461DRAFT_74642 [Myriangium duriaei CBS 260.36]